MSKQRSFGQDVIVRLSSADGRTNFIIDFDSINVSSLTEGKIKKGIGKRVGRPQSNSSGYKVTLSRTKRDNYLESLVQMNDYYLNSGLDQPIFSLTHTINHPYYTTSINPYLEFGGDTASGFGLAGLARVAQSLVGDVEGLVNKFINNYKEEYIYQHGIILAPNSSYEVKEVGKEQLTLLFASRVSNNDANLYDDKYIPDYVRNDIINTSDKIVDKYVTDIRNPTINGGVNSPLQPINQNKVLSSVDVINMLESMQRLR